LFAASDFATTELHISKQERKRLKKKLDTGKEIGLLATVVTNKLPLEALKESQASVRQRVRKEKL
jgi:hypothetical protein